MPSNREIFFEAVEAERKRQDERWGGRAHDIEHWGNDWISFITKQVGAACGYSLGNSEFETRMIRVAALALAAYEAGRPREDV